MFLIGFHRNTPAFEGHGSTEGRASSIVCKSSGGHRRNPDFSRQNKQVSRNLDDSDLLTSKNGSLLSFSGTPKFQATAAPGPKEEEIVELFKKLLRKHSTEQGKKKTSNISSGNFNLDQPENGAYKKAKGTSSFNSSKKERNVALEPNTSFTRPPSNFRRKSPVPRVKFQPIYSSEDLVNSTSRLNSNGEKRNQFEILPDTSEELELDPEIEPEEEPKLDSEQEPQSAFPGGDMFDELSEGESSDIENVDEGGEKHRLIEYEVLSSLKLPELRVLAKSRGVKGFSKMNKRELVELLSGSSV
ncbi:hypothetical protein NC653_014377 [Populus alba x Populus x berolinensis]|uniref:Rho termination factor-like N-terminal domain-containing protein n=1 Tax=Populus alba x Populus x berolinensis TaxID=444605 RepID=A0AAD6W3U1_9ROSI|nr:hypothetical protein NC653_014377 [Populus alba x Populus x berolinensis]